MSLNEQTKSCAFCHAYLFSEDDVVYCPECGAPHHRECYNQINRCALAEFHGTENQYDKLKEKSEEMVAVNEPAEPQENTENAENTEHGENSENGDGMSFQTPFGIMTAIDFLGGVKPEDEIEDGVTAKEAAKFIAVNTVRYIPKFKKLSKKNKASWNFLAFFFPCEWFLSRKMYLYGIIAGALKTISALLTFPFQTAAYNLGINLGTFDPQAMQTLTDSMIKMPKSILYVAFLGGLINIAISIVFGILGDWIYRKHALGKIKEIKAESEDAETDYRRKGGVNIFLFLVGFFAMQYIPIIMFAFIK